MPPAEHAALLLDRWLRGYLSQGRPPLSLDELADLAFAAREAAEKLAKERREMPVLTGRQD